MYATTVTAVSHTVASAIVNKTQMPTMVAMMGDPALNRNDYGFAVLQAASGTAFEGRSLKSWQNYVSAARAARRRIEVQCPERLSSSAAITEWLTNQLTAGGFDGSAEDMANWAHGRDSRKIGRTKTTKKEAAMAAERARSWMLREAALNSQRVREQAGQTLAKQPVLRLGSISEGADSVEAEARVYLRTQYTNQNEVMICQVCQDKLPFKLPNGDYYFEAVVISETLGNTFRQTYLSLCPNHAAMFKHANEQRVEILELLAKSSDQEVEVTLGGIAKTIWFTDAHLADIKACLEAEEAEEAETLKPHEQTEPLAKSQLHPPSLPNWERQTVIRSGRPVIVTRIRIKGRTDS